MVVACRSFDPRSPCTSLVQPPPNYSKMSNPVVFFDMTIGGAPAGRIEMTLRADVVPKTVEVRRTTLSPFAHHRSAAPLKRA